MLTQGEDVEVHALARRGWSISAIARHIERDRKTVRAYLAGERQPGVRRRSAPDLLEPFIPYLAARFGDDPHLWLTALHHEVRPLGYTGSYQALARGVRRARLRPHCEACAGVRGRETIEIEHPPGRGDPVGLVRAPTCALGWHGLHPPGHAVALGPGPGRAGRVDGPAPSRGGHGQIGR